MAIAVVQTATAYDPPTGACSFSRATTAGNCVVVFIFTYALASQTITTTGITLGGSADHFQQAVAVQTTPVAGDTDYLAAWIDPNCAGGQTAVAASVTNATWQGQFTGTGLILMELSGVAASSALDVSSKSAPGATGSTASSGTTAGTAVAGEMALGAVIDAETFTGTDGSYTNVTMGSPISCIAGYMPVPGAGTGVSYSAPANVNNVVAGIVFTLKPATSSPVPPVITTASLPGGTAGTTYSAVLAATSGSGSGYTWSVSSGALPAGLTLSSAGVISGTPAAAGASNFTVRVADSAGNTATQPLSITVSPAVVTGPTTYSALLYRQADGTEPSSFTITGLNGTTPVTAAIVTVAGGATALDPPVPVMVAGSSGTTIPVSGITLNHAGDWLLWFAGDEAGFGGPGYAITPPAGFTSQATNGATTTPGSIGSTAAPSLVQYAETSWVTSGTESTTALTWNAGDVIVVIGAADGYQALASGPTATGLAFSAVPGALCNAAGNCYANAWTATAASAGSSVVTLAGPGISHWGIGTWAWRGSSGIGSVTSSGATANAALTQSLTLSGTDSCVVGGVFDYAGGSTSGYQWVPSAANDRDHGQDGTDYSYYVADWGNQGAPATTPFGLAGLTGTGPFARLFIEVKGIAVPASGTAGTNATVMVAVNEAASAGPTGTQAGTITATADYEGIMVGITPASIGGGGGGGPAAAPSLIQYAETNWTGTGAKSTPAISWQPGDVILVLGASASSANPVSLGSITVSNPGITTTSLPGATAGISYSATLTATGGTAPYVWGISAGALPAWAGLAASTGIISGVPSGSGTASFTAQVTDSASGRATQALSITTLTTLAVTTASLPAGTLSTAYTTTLTASGGTAPYTWSISSGALPSWASLNTSSGVITGTPNASATTSFTVKVTDSASNAAVKALSVTVSAPASTAPNGPPGTWNLVFEDDFPGTSLNTSNWTALQGASINNVSTSASAVSVSGGQLRVGYTGAVNSNPASGYAGPSSGPAVVLGNCVEASINFPNGNNWSAWWCDAGSWPSGGEEDIAEILGGSLTALNYHCPTCGPSPGYGNNGPTPGGSWFGSFHTYTCVRGSSTLSVYWDGVLVRSVARNDDGAAQAMIINMGSGGSGSTILVDYVRMWTPG